MIKRGLIPESKRTIDPKSLKECEQKMFAGQSRIDTSVHPINSKQDCPSSKRRKKDSDADGYIQVVSNIGNTVESEKETSQKATKKRATKAQVKTAKKREKAKPDEIEDIIGVANFFGHENEVQTYKSPGLYFLVTWKGYPSNETTYEPMVCIEKYHKQFGKQKHTFFSSLYYQEFLLV